MAASELDGTAEAGTQEHPLKDSQVPTKLQSPPVPVDRYCPVGVQLSATAKLEVLKVEIPWVRMDVEV